jgi:hypothetical protein
VAVALGGTKVGIGVLVVAVVGIVVAAGLDADGNGVTTGSGFTRAHPLRTTTHNNNRRMIIEFLFIIVV